MAKLLALSALLLSTSSLVTGFTIPSFNDLYTKRDDRGLPMCDMKTVPMALGDVQMCIRYLIAQKTRKTTEPIICDYNNVQVYVEGDEGTSYASDLAAGVQWVADNCVVKGEKGLVHGGIAVANGNGNAVVWTFPKPELEFSSSSEVAIATAYTTHHSHTAQPTHTAQTTHTSH